MTWEGVSKALIFDYRSCDSSQMLQTNVLNGDARRSLRGKERDEGKFSSNYFYVVQSACNGLSWQLLSPESVLSQWVMACMALLCLRRNSRSSNDNNIRGGKRNSSRSSHASDTPAILLFRQTSLCNIVNYTSTTLNQTCFPSLLSPSLSPFTSMRCAMLIVTSERLHRPWLLRLYNKVFRRMMKRISLVLYQEYSLP